jgi:Flp pilus assembly protein TadD
VGLDEGLRWAETAAHGPGVGQENFSTLTTLADLQAANGKADEAKKTMDLALNHRTVGPRDLHQYGRQLQQQNKNEEAMKVFEANAKRFPDQWPVHVGLARGHFALGHKDKALAEARTALKQAPDEASKKGVEALIQQIEGPKGAS